MEQRSKVVGNIVLIFVVLHNMLRIHQSRPDRAPTPANDVANMWLYVPDNNYRDRSKEKTSATTTERLLQSSWCIGWAGKQDLR